MKEHKYIPFLDGFRGYAILLVLLGHLTVQYRFLAQFGVTLFFFVSGFLITKLLIEEYDKSNTINLKDFYIRRLFRLYPALLVYLVVTCIAVWVMQFDLVGLDIVAGLFYFTNYYIAYFPPIVPDSYPLTAKILWSLSVEEHFYLIFPPLFLILFTTASRRFLYVVFGLILLTLVARGVAYINSKDIIATINQTYYATHFRADSILYGCLVALLLYADSSSKIANMYKSALKSKIVLISAVVVVFLCQIYEAAWYQITIKYSCTGVLLCLIVPAFIYLRKDGILNTAFINRFIIYIGKLSYSLYLFHWVSLKFVSHYMPEPNLKWLLVVLTTSFALAVLSYHFVERPFLKLRRRFGSHAR